VRDILACICWRWIGAAARHGINVLSGSFFGTALPFGTLIVNVVGSLLIGLLLLVAYLAFKGGASQHLRLFLTTGVLGGFTTFSAFSHDVALLYERGDLWIAAAYIVASVLLSLTGLFLGLWLMRKLS